MGIEIAEETKETRVKLACMLDIYSDFVYLLWSYVTRRL